MGCKEADGPRSKVLHVDCRLDNKHQQSSCDICVMYVHGGVAPGVIQPLSEAWATFSSCKPLVTECDDIHPSLSLLPLFNTLDRYYRPKTGLARESQEDYLNP